MNPFFDSLAQELQAHAQPAAPDSSHPPAHSVRLPPPVQKPIASTILPLSLTSAVRQRMRWSKSRNFRSIRVGHSIRVLRASFDAWLEEEGL